MMKKILCALLCCLLLIPACGLATVGDTAANAGTPAAIDLTGMSFDELVALRDQIDMAIWGSQEWQEVTVPQGVYEVGKDIPEGHWTIKPVEGAYSYVKWGDKLDATGKDLDWSGDLYFSENVTSAKYDYFKAATDKEQIDIDAKAGQYIIIDSGKAVFTPYAGGTSLGFK